MVDNTDNFNNLDNEEEEGDIFNLNNLEDILYQMAQELTTTRGEISISFHVMIDTKHLDDESFKNGGFKKKIAIGGTCKAASNIDQKHLSNKLKTVITESFDLDEIDTHKGDTYSQTPFLHLPENLEE